jgi:hypothetical protein
MFWKKVTTCAIGVLIAALMFEVAIRYTPFAEVHMVTYDSRRGWGLLPGAEELYTREGRGHVKINRDGLRDVDHAKPKPADTFRIAVVGDSYAEADQVELDRTFWWVMQERLRACPALAGKRVEAINFGVRAYGTAQELFSLRYHAWQYSPDFVVLAIYIGNDIRNNSVRLEPNKCRPFFVERDGHFVLGGPFVDSSFMRFRCMVRYESRKSQVANVLGDAVMRVRSSLRDWARPNPSPQKANGAKSKPEWPLDPVFVEPRDPVWDGAWRATDVAITMVAREAESHHAGFLAVTLSDAFQVYPDKARRAAYQKELGVDDLFYPERRIAALGEREGFAVLNLAPALQAYADEHHAYLHGFGSSGLGAYHWNELGHKLGGELIADDVCGMIGRSRQTGQPSTGSTGH